MEISCLPTLFWRIYFLTNGSFGLSRTFILILGYAIAISKKKTYQGVSSRDDRIFINCLQSPENQLTIFWIDGTRIQIINELYTL